MSLFLLPDGIGLGSVHHHHLEPLLHKPVLDLRMNLHHVGCHPVGRLDQLQPCLRSLLLLQQITGRFAPLLVLLRVPSSRDGGDCSSGGGGGRLSGGKGPGSFLSHCSSRQPQL